jgi:hypothetical protein
MSHSMHSMERHVVLSDEHRVVLFGSDSLNRQTQSIHLQCVNSHGACGSMAISWQVAGLSPNEVIEFFSIYLILPAALGPGVCSASHRHELQKQKTESNHFLNTNRIHCSLG